MYIDDVYVNESILSAEYVRAKLAPYGLMYKHPECMRDGARVLGLEVLEECNTLWWTRGRAIPNIPDVMTRRNVQWKVKSLHIKKMILYVCTTGSLIPSWANLGHVSKQQARCWCEEG